MVAVDEPQPAWILHARPYRETSLLVEALTLHSGRVGFIARGVRGPRAQPLRAALQPLQAVLLGLRGRGELLMLASAEIRDRALVLAGRPLLSAFYINELLMRLLPRQQPQPGLFWRYAICINSLADESGIAWTLRRFERDLLQSLGYALPLALDATSGAEIDPAQCYRLDPERGAILVMPGAADAVSGAALLALAQDVAPPPDLLAELRPLMRRMLRWRLGGLELRSWRILEDIGQRAEPSRTRAQPMAQGEDIEAAEPRSD
jgi:DNA repair protein RecO (recombination protein O)